MLPLNQDWMAEAAETKQALAALQQAITVLADATAPGKKAKVADANCSITRASPITPLGLPSGEPYSVT